MPINDAEIIDLIKELEAVIAVRVKVKEAYHHEIGDKIIEWATNTSTRPECDENGVIKNVDAFKSDFGSRINIPDHIKKIRFVQPEEGEYIIRLPGKEQVTQSAKVMEKLEDGRGEMTAAQLAAHHLQTTYPIPSFYDRFSESEGEDPKPKELLRCRVADYTFAMCT